MLQNVRDNMKGTVAIIVVLIFVVPMVLTGFGDSSMFSGVTGSDAAKVNKRSISNIELERAVYQQRERMKSQGMDAASDQLKDENLRGPVLQQLTQQAAVVTLSKQAGMGVSDEQFFEAIREAPQFQVDGAFDREVYRQQISNQGHTPATFKNFVADILLIQQNYNGINSSAFVTDAEVDAMIAIAHQKRSFATIELPSKELEKTISVTDEEIAEYYQNNQSEFIEPEKMSVAYLELSVENLMKDISISEEAVKQRYEQEKQDFQTQEREPEVQIAHLMLEKADDGSHQQTLADITARLEAGEEFAALVKEYSIDEGSKDTGGDLGVLIPGTFSEAFEQAAMALEEGEVSAPVETDGGVHLIKLLAKNVESFPAFEERSKAIEQSLKREQAEEIYATMERDFEDLTFSAQDLQAASEALNLKIQTSELFERGSGTGIARNKMVRDAAWMDDVLLDGRNSPKVQLGAGHSVVLRKQEHVPEHVLALEKVKADIESSLKAEKLASLMKEQAAEVIAALQGGADAKTLSEEKGYTFNSYDKVKLYEVPVDFAVRQKVFELPASDATVYDSVNKDNGNAVVVALSEVVKGKREDMPKEQIDIMRSQLARQNAMAEYAAYQSKLVSDSKIKVY